MDKLEPWWQYGWFLDGLGMIWVHWQIWWDRKSVALMKGEMYSMWSAERSFVRRSAMRRGASQKHVGLVRDLNPGPLAPKARIIPLDQRATWCIFKSGLTSKWRYWSTKHVTCGCKTCSFQCQIHLLQSHIVHLKSPMGSSGIWTRDLSHPKRESYP